MAKNSEVTAFENDDPKLEGSAPAPSDRDGQIEGFAQEGIADFAKMGSTIAGAPPNAILQELSPHRQPAAGPIGILYQLTRLTTWRR